MAKYKVKNTTILHDGKAYGSGEEVELNNDEAKRLGEWVVLIKEKTPKQPDTKVTVKTQPKTEQKNEPQNNNESESGDNDGK